MSKHRTLAIILSIEAVLNLGLSIILLQKLGITGVAIATAIPTLGTALFYTLPKACKLLGLGYSKILKEFSKPIAAALIGVPVLLLAKHFIIFQNLVQVLLVGIVYVLVYSAVLYKFDPDLKVFLNSKIRKQA